MSEKTPTYEQAREELAAVVRQLEAGGATLEESLALWERGEALATICQQLLDGVKATLEAARPAGASGVADGDVGAGADADED